MAFRSTTAKIFGMKLMHENPLLILDINLQYINPVIAENTTKHLKTEIVDKNGI